MRITGLTVRNLGPFADLALEFPEGKDDTLADVYLFVGENGTGKSTLLHAIATALWPGGVGQSNLERLIRRTRTPDWYVRLDNSERSVVLEMPEKPTDDYQISSLLKTLGRPLDAMASFHPDRRANFAAFAYAGSRTFDQVFTRDVTQNDINWSISPLDFSRDQDTHEFAQWWVNRWLSAAGLKMNGEEAEAKAYLRTQELITAALRDITGLELRFDVDPRTRDLAVGIDGQRLAFSVLPEGLKSLLTWMGNLYARMDRLTWENDLPIEQRPFLLLLDEIDVHLHPTWQRKVLPIVQRLFPKAQIFATTHSPFVVGSAADARIYPLVRNPDGTARLMSPAEVGEEVQGNLSAGLLSRKGWSYPAILRQVFGVKETFDLGTTEDLNRFYELRNLVLKGRKPVLELQWAAQGLAKKYSTEVQDIVMDELRQTLIATLGR